MKNNFYKILLLVVASFFADKANAQALTGNSYNKLIDSLNKVLQHQKEDTNKVKTLNLLGIYYNYQSNYSSAINTFFSASKLSEKLNYTTGNAASLSGIAENYRWQSNFPVALQYYYKALQFYEQLQSKTDIKDCLNDIGGVNASQGNYTEALKSYKAGLKINEELGDKESIAFSFLTIARTYQLLGDNAEALKNNNAALKIRQVLGSKWQICQSYINIGKIYLNEKNYREALRTDSMALKISLEINDKNLSWTVAMCNGAIGDVYEKQGDFNDSIGNKVIAQQMYLRTLKSYLTSLNIWQKNGGTDYTIAGVGGGVGEIYIKLKQFTKARFYLENTLDVFKKNGDKSQIEETYQTLSVLDSAEGNYKKGYEDYKMYIIYRDSIYNEDNTKKTLQSNMQYEFDKKEVVTKAAQDKKDADAKRTRNQQYFAIAALGVVVIAILIIALIQFRNNKQKQKTNLLITQQKQKVEITLTELKSTQAQLIQSEKMASLGELTAGIAHEIQNPLNFVNNFSDVNKELVDELQSELKAGNAEEAIAISNDIKENEEKINHHGKRADAIVKGMLQHSRSSTGVKEPTDINALADEYLRLSYHGIRAKDKDFNADIKTDFDNSIGKVNIVPQDIGRVLLNLYNNAFYAVNEKTKMKNVTYEPTISVTTKKVNNSIELTVRDNGNGIPQKIVDKIFQPFFTTKPTGEGTGLGLSLAYDIIKAHGGEIKVETKEGKGTKFVIQLPFV